MIKSNVDEYLKRTRSQERVDLSNSYTFNAVCRHVEPARKSGWI